MTLLATHSPEKRKNLYHKKSHQGWTQNKKFWKQKVKNQKLNTLMNCQHIFNALTTQKSVAVYFKDVKTEETFSSQDQKLVETTKLWQLSSDKKPPQRKFATATIGYSVDLMIGTTMNASRKFISHKQSWKLKKIVSQKIASRMNKKRHISVI